VPRAGATVEGAAVAAQLRTQIANFKIPKQVFVVPELPRNAMGKVQKNLLRDQYRTLFSR
jgi:malonyl-CoA/methylmalonyl-CoA synthetase